MFLFVNTPDLDNQLVRNALHAWTVFRLTCSLHRVHCSLFPEQGNSLKFTLFRNIHSWICAAQRLHAQTSVTLYTSVNIYNFNSHLAHFNALWMEYIRSLRTGIMAEYPVMSTSQGTYVRIEQTSEAIRVTYEICRAGGGARTGIENRCFKATTFSATHVTSNQQLSLKMKDLWSLSLTANPCKHTYTTILN